MAQKVNIVLIDDIDDTDASETVRFGLDGSNYEIDLNDKNAKKLREALAPYVAAGRKVAAGKRSRGAAKGGGSSTPASQIRDWARDQGYEVPDRGRIPADIRSAYDAAH
ncbi:Lsr2 family protein [Nocardioides panacisoli]|uniref:histone-like nucleoid-structuring protein Lsr2 n=1 Tax=Nocardioides panacisoli TaxID=627624 RepID=UPI001C630C14|nr:Lsr2 family protein [Nocardioides panacisoli]QYJ03745.1 Lsr2 family protein [Nocardioides panacisoli]